MPKELAVLQRAIASLLEKTQEDEQNADERMECYLLKESESHYRLVWPNLFVERAGGEELVNRIKIRFAEEAALATHESKAIDLTGETYARGFNRMLGAISPTPPGQPPPSSSSECQVKVMAIYDEQGKEAVKGDVRKKVALTARECVEATASYNADLWRPSTWRK